jgi:hypothetical protein
MTHITCLVVKVSYASGCSKNTWKASASGRHKTKQTGHQGRRPNKAARLTRQSGLLALFSACSQCSCFLKWVSYKLICVEQYTSLRYPCI